DFAKRVMAFEEHQDPARNLNDFERPDGEHDSWKTHRVAFQDRIVAARCSFGAVTRLVGIVPRFSPRSKLGKVVAGALASAARRELPHSGEVMRRLRLQTRARKKQQSSEK